MSRPETWEKYRLGSGEVADSQFRKAVEAIEAQLAKQ